MILGCGKSQCGINFKIFKLYLKENPELAKQVKIILVAHFDPFQASNNTADPNVFTMDFLHKYGVINDQMELGKEKILMAYGG